MMFPFKNAKGFSLIELIVVMAIMAVLMSLSGGLFQKSIAQQERHVEFEQVRQLFKRLSYQAYYGGQPLKVRLEESSIFINNLNENEDIERVNQLDFKQLTFVAQSYHISTQGIISPNTFGVFGLDSIKHLPLESTFNEISTE